MEQFPRLLCCVALLVLPCPALGAGAPTADGTISHVGKVGAIDERHLGLRASKASLPSTNLRRQRTIVALQASQSTHLHASKVATKKQKRVASKQRSQSRLRRPIVALQASQSTQLHAAKAGAKKRKRAAAKRSRSWLQRRSKMHRRMTQGLKRRFKNRQHLSRRQQETQKLGGCRSSKLKWWLKIKKKCIKAYGDDSRWDREKGEGKCAEAWSNCNTGFYAVCCSQKVGAKTADAYCAGQALTFVNASHVNASKDKLCQVQNKMRAVKKVMKNIKQTVSLMDVTPPIQAKLVEPGPAPMPAPAPAPERVVPPAGLLAAAPAPSLPPPVLILPPPPAQATLLVDRCTALTELTREAAKKIKAIKSWAKKDGIKGEDESSSVALLQSDPDDDIAEFEQDGNTENPEAKDPDLFFSVKAVLHAGEKLNALLKNPNFCKGVDESEYDEDEAEEDLKKDPTEDWDDDDDEEEDSADIQEVTIDEAAIMDLLNWETDMTTAVDKFEKDVHPHGFKWWRYRYEYTIVESIVLAFSVLFLYFVMWLLKGVSFFQVSKFYKTGLTSRLHRYAWAYVVFHAASLMVMVTFSYMLYIPWGKQNIFNMFAESVHDFVDDRANVPFLGYSWLYMVLDVQFQLFVCFALYSLFVMFVTRNYQKALEDWKTLSDNIQDASAKKANVQLYKSIESVMKRRVQNTPEYRQMFHELKLSFSGVGGLDAFTDRSEFRLHLYLTDGLGKSLEYLVQVSLTTNIFLACSALVVALLAHHYQVAFMYFLPGFLVVGCVLFIAGYFVARHFRALSDKDDHNTPAKYVTVHSYCRTIQIMLYCVFFSFSRLLCSNDIFEFYPNVYLSAVVGLVIVLVLLGLVAGEAIKDTTCALILPPHIPQDRFKQNLVQIVQWHSADFCHEFGVQQFSGQYSLSREWAGKRPAGERKDDAVPDTSRPLSFR